MGNNSKTAELNEIIIIQPPELEVTLDDEWSYFTIESKANEEIIIELEFSPEELKSYFFLTTYKQRSSTLKNTISYHVNLTPQSKKTIYINIKEAAHTSRYILYGIKDRLSNKSQLIVKEVKVKEKIELKRLPFIISEKRRKPKNVDPIQSNKNDINNNRTSSVAKSNVIPFSVSVDNPLKLFDLKKPSELEKDNYEFKKDVIESTKAKDRINTTNYSIKHSDPNLNSKLLPKNITSSIDTIDTFDTSLKPSKFNEVNSEVKEDTNIGEGKSKEKADNSNRLVRLLYVSSYNLKGIIIYCQDEKFIKERLESRLIKKLEGNRNALQDEMYIDKSNDWYQKFQNHIAGANVLIMLISETFLNSKFILNENIRKLLADCKNKGLYIMPVVTRICLWREEKLWTQLGIEVFHNKGRALIGHGEKVFDEQLDKIVNKIMDFVSSAKTPDYKEDNTPTGTDKKNKEIEKSIPPKEQQYKHDEENPPLAEEKLEVLKKQLISLGEISKKIVSAKPSISKEGESDSILSANLKFTLQGISQYFESLESDELIGHVISDVRDGRKPLESDNERIRRDLIFTVFGPFFCSSAEVLKKNMLYFDELPNLLKDIHIDLKSIPNDISIFLKDYYKLKAMEITLGVSRYNEYEHEIAGYAKVSENYKPRTIISVQRWGYKSLDNKIVEKAIVLLNA